MAESNSDPAQMALTTPNDCDPTTKTTEYVTANDAVLNLNDMAATGQGREAEEALEIHEVVELNKFITKKEWIEDKIKLLESMPPIEVFAAVDTIVTMSEAIPPGLPTRAQLNHWLEEHEQTEKETEIFDAEDMSKLKKLTKAATQRNLSPEDTDLIELTLTTLLALDKLLHLLRDRSDTLELLALRLTWEEQRVAAWKDLKSILDDLRSFLVTRARWSLDTYERNPPTATSPPPGISTSPSPSSSPRLSPTPSTRRDSTASLASLSSFVSLSNPPFSRSTRYKLAEVLSHDAALFSGRITALNHSKILPAGKTLDKLIDASRSPVPDEILDEQDRLEDKGIKDVETIGRFVMSMVMQWRRADEQYSDIKKDQTVAQGLISELNSAKLQHPTSRLAAAFMSRAQALTKRLAVKGDPALPRSSFPRPTHPLFPDQNVYNEEIVKTLSMELAEARKLALEAEAEAFAYHKGLGTVQRAESLRDQMRVIDQQLKEVIRRFSEGVHDEQGHGDGSPLDLSKEICLDPTRHATYLALLPSAVQQFETVDHTCVECLQDGREILTHLKGLSGIDPSLVRELTDVMEALDSRRSTAKWNMQDVLDKAQRLKEARRFWKLLSDIIYSLEDLKKDVVHEMEIQQKKLHDGRGYAPLTPEPESPEMQFTPLPPMLNPGRLLQHLDEIERRMTDEFKVPCAVLFQTLEIPLQNHLQSSSEGITRHIGEMRRMARIWESLIGQSDSMIGMKRGVHDLKGRIEDPQDVSRQDIRSVASAENGAVEMNFKDKPAALQTLAKILTNSIAPLASRGDGPYRNLLDSNSIPTFRLPSPLSEAFQHEQERQQIESSAILGQKLAKEEDKEITMEHGGAKEGNVQQEKTNVSDLGQTDRIEASGVLQGDVFGLKLSPSVIQPSHEMMALRARIMSLRNRLKTLNLKSLVEPSQEHHGVALPTLSRALDVQSDFSAIVLDTTSLPSSVQGNADLESELGLLRSEVATAHDSVRRIVQIGQFTDKVSVCDHALSDLLEHTDSYPLSPPAHHLVSSHVSDMRLPDEEQLKNRLTFTNCLIEEMSQLASPLTEDPRVAGEERRIRQALSELAEICADRINGKRSRPGSSVSFTGRSDLGSSQNKTKPSLNLHPQRRPHVSETPVRRTVSILHRTPSRPVSHMSNRSVSGPSGFSSLFNSTFSSRQRTTSLASIPSIETLHMKRPMSPVRKPRTSTNRPNSPTSSDVSSFSPSSTPPRSTWPRAPRQSFPAMVRNFQVPDKTPKHKKYVANPNSKLDVAVGNVVNNSKFPVTIQAVDAGWKDQSGKYWIGEDEQKLCFCRILRSQTVMVRVGGGWCELSSFLRTHFAELSSELTSPPQRKEKWISAATILEDSENTTLSPDTRHSKTPEPQPLELVPALQLSTPSGASPQSIRSASSLGSSPGLTPFKFLRKADAGALAATPSSKRTRSKPTTPNVVVTPARTNVWRP